MQNSTGCIKPCYGAHSWLASRRQYDKRSNIGECCIVNRAINLPNECCAGCIGREWRRRLFIREQQCRGRCDQAIEAID
jgi:hypothetical protein